MDDKDWLTNQFETHRSHLQAVAYRMLGSLSEADNAVQESWLHLNRSDMSTVENMRGWLTTVVARICLDILRSRKSRREEPLDAHMPDQIMSREAGIDPEHETLMADSVGLALLVVLDTLNPAERLAFVLHDIFAVPFDEIAPIVRRSPTATRQLASRARRRVQGTPAVQETPEVPNADLTRQQEIVSAFLAASRGGDFDALLAVLDPDAVLRADDTAAQLGAPSEVYGASAVAGFFFGRARGARPAIVNGAAGAVWDPGRTPRVVFDFTIIQGKVVAINLRADASYLSELQLTIID